MIDGAYSRAAVNAASAAQQMLLSSQQQSIGLRAIIERAGSCGNDGLLDKCCGQGSSKAFARAMADALAHVAWLQQ